MDSLLLVGSTEKSRALLQALVLPADFSALKVCQSGAEARRFSAGVECAMVIINTPLSDESGLDLALEFAHKTTAGVLLLVKADLAEAVAARVEEFGVLVLPKPISKIMFDQAFRFSLAMRKRMVMLHEENLRLEKKLTEVRLVDRAKCVLIQYLGMTEDQAHRQIEKQAMDSRQTKAAIARAILSTYEL